MPNVKNRRIEVDGVGYRWSSIGNDGGIAISVGLDGDRSQAAGRRVVSNVPHNVLVLPSLVARLIRQAIAEGWNPNAPTPRSFHSPLAPPFLDAPDRRRRPREDPYDHDDHISAIRAAPDDDAPRLVYADWLLERGDPRGEFIILDCKVGKPDFTREEEQRRSAILAENEDRWLGPLSYVTRARFWRRGFIREVGLTRKERGVVAPAIGESRWWSVTTCEARASFLADQDIAHIVAMAPFDDLEVLRVELPVLELLLREGDGWVPRALEVYAAGVIATDVLAAVAAFPRLSHLKVAADLLPREALTFARPGLSLSVADPNADEADWDAARPAFDSVTILREVVRHFPVARRG